MHDLQESLQGEIQLDEAIISPQGKDTEMPKLQLQDKQSIHAQFPQAEMC